MGPSAYSTPAELFIFITRDSEAKIFSPCVFDCLCVTLFVTMFFVRVI